MLKPIMSPSVEEDVTNALMQFQRRDLWKKWGMMFLREQGPAILLTGPPGTGKTTIAAYIAAKVGKGFKKLDVAGLSSGGSPGEYEKQINEFFADCKKRGWATIFMDECDHLLLSRDEIGEAGKTWQLGGVEGFMMNMNIYRGLIICATNHPQSIDPALADRFLSIIHVDVPDFDMRRRLWKQKLPKSFPLQLSEDQIKALSKYELTGRQIETVIINTALNSIRTGKKPSVGNFEIYCEREKEKHVGKTSK